MGWYLSPQNEKLLPPILRILSSPSNGRVEIPTTSPKDLLYLIRSAANTKYPQLKEWRYKEKENRVICIPKLVSITIPANQNEDYLEYLDIVSYISSHDINEMVFTNHAVSKDEFPSLVVFGDKKGYNITKEGSNIRVIKNVPEKPIQSTENGGGESG